MYTHLIPFILLFAFQNCVDSEKFKDVISPATTTEFCEWWSNGHSYFEVCEIALHDLLQKRFTEDQIYTVLQQLRFSLEFCENRTKANVTEEYVTCFNKFAKPIAYCAPLYLEKIQNYDDLMKCFDMFMRKSKTETPFNFWKDTFMP